MNDVKVQILADATNAIRNIEEFSKKLSRPEASLSQLSKRMRKFQAELADAKGMSAYYKALGKLRNSEIEYTKHIQIEIETLKAQGATYGELQKYISKLTKAKGEFLNMGNVNFAMQLDGQIKSLEDMALGLQKLSNQYEHYKQQAFEVSKAVGEYFEEEAERIKASEEEIAKVRQAELEAEKKQEYDLARQRFDNTEKLKEAIQQQAIAKQKADAAELERSGRIIDAYKIRIDLLEQERTAALASVNRGIAWGTSSEADIGLTNAYYDNQRAVLEGQLAKALSDQLVTETQLAAKEQERLLLAQQRLEAEQLQAYQVEMAQLKAKDEQMALEAQMTAEAQMQLDIARLLGDDQVLMNAQLQEAMMHLEDMVANFGAMSPEARQAAKAVLEIRGNIEAASKSTAGFLSRLVTLAKNILIFQLILGPVRKLVSGIGDTIRDSTKLAAEAEQTFNKLSIVFEGVGESAQSMARSLANEIGVANSTAASALSTIGDLLQAQGMAVVESLQTASEWAEQFQDIIAFKDIDMSLEEFAQNFMSGAAGNLRNFRTFGSIVKESAVQAELAAKGLDKLTGEQLELQKMVIRANMALNQQANAMGATEREWNTTLSINRRWNEELKTTKELLGEAINEQLDKVKSKATEVLSRFNRMQKLLKSMEAGDIATEEWSNTPQNRQAIADAADRDYSAAASKAVSATIAAGLAAAIGSMGVALPEGLTTALGVGLLGVSSWLGGKAAQHAASAVPTVEELLALADATGASVTQIAEVLKEESKVSNSVVAKWAKLDDTLAKNLAEADKQYKDKKAKEAARVNNFASLQTASAGYDSFIEGLLGITGVDFIPSSFSGEDFDVRSHSDTETNSILSKIQEATLDSVTSALESMDLIKTSKQLADVYGDAISGALDELDEGQLRESQIEAYRTLFETAWNEYGRDGKFTKEELASLENIKTSYGNAIDALNDYNDALELSATILENIASPQANAASAQGTLADYLLQKDLNAKYGSELGANEFNRQKAESDALAGYKMALGNIRASSANADQITDSFMASVMKGIDKGTFTGEFGIKNAGTGDSIFTAEQVKQLIEAKKSYDAWMKAITEYYDHMANDIEKAEETALTNSRLQGAKDWKDFKGGIHEKQYTGKYAEADQWLDEMMSSMDDILADMFDKGYSQKELKALRKKGVQLINEEYKAKTNEIDATNKAAEALKKMEYYASLGQNALSSSGHAGALVQSGMEGFKEAGVWGAIAGVAMQILEIVGAFEALNEVLDPLIEGVLKPLGPALKQLAGLAGILLETALEPLLPWIKAASYGLTLVFGILKAGIQYIADGFRWVIGNIAKGFVNMRNAIANALNSIEIFGWHPFSVGTTQMSSQMKAWSKIDPNGNFEKNMQEMRDSLIEIESYTLQTAKNTEKDDDYAKQLAVLKGLYDDGALSLAEYSGAVKRTTGSSMGSIEKYSGSSYATGNGGVTYYSGDIVINGYNKDPEALALEIERVLEKRSQAGATTFA